ASPRGSGRTPGAEVRTSATSSLSFAPAAWPVTWWPSEKITWMGSPTGHSACAFVITRSWSTKKPDAMLFEHRSATVEAMDCRASARVESGAAAPRAAAGTAVAVPGAVGAAPFSRRAGAGRSDHHPANASPATMATPNSAFFVQTGRPEALAEGSVYP